MINYTRRKKILSILGNKSGLEMTCANISRIIAKHEDIQDKRLDYLNGSISSILRKMVKDGEIEYGLGQGPRAGHTYRIKPIEFIKAKTDKLYET